MACSHVMHFMSVRVCITGDWPASCQSWTSASWHCPLALRGLCPCHAFYVCACVHNRRVACQLSVMASASWQCPLTLSTGACTHVVHFMSVCVRITGGCLLQAVTNECCQLAVPSCSFNGGACVAHFMSVHVCMTGVVHFMSVRVCITGGGKGRLGWRMALHTTWALQLLVMASASWRPWEAFPPSPATHKLSPGQCLQQAWSVFCPCVCLCRDHVHSCQHRGGEGGERLGRQPIGGVWEAQGGRGGRMPLLGVLQACSCAANACTIIAFVSQKGQIALHVDADSYSLWVRTRVSRGFWCEFAWQSI